MHGSHGQEEPQQAEGAHSPLGTILHFAGFLPWVLGTGDPPHHLVKGLSDLGFSVRASFGMSFPAPGKSISQTSSSTANPSSRMFPDAVVALW